MSYIIQKGDFIINFSDQEETLIKMLLSQAKYHEPFQDMVIGNESHNNILTLIESREIYIELYGYKFKEEKELLPKLKTKFQLLVDLNS